MSGLDALASYDISDDEGEKSFEKNRMAEKAESDALSEDGKIEETEEKEQKTDEIDGEDIWSDPEVDDEKKTGDDSIKDVEDLSVVHDGSDDEVGRSSGEENDNIGILGESMTVKPKRRVKRRSSENATNLAKKLRTSSVDEVSIPPEPEGRCSTALQNKINRFMERKVKEGEDLNRLIQSRKDFRNPSIYEKLIVYLGIKELGTNFPSEDYDPKIWRKAPAYDELARAQREDMAKRDKERKTKVEFVTGTVKKSSLNTGAQGGSSSGDGVKRTKWDQQGLAKSSSDKGSGHKSTIISAKIMKSHALAMCAGCLGAIASATGKLGMDGGHVIKFCEHATDVLSGATTENEFNVTLMAASVLRIVFILITFLLNAAMWSLFMESMQGLNSGEAVVLNTGSNILISAVLGRLIFGETFGTLWWIGASFILCGMAILQSRSTNVPEEKSKKGN